MADTGKEMANVAGNFAGDGKAKAAESAAKAKEFLTGGSPIGQVILAFILIIVLSIVIKLIKTIFYRMKDSSKGVADVVEGAKSAKKRKVIPQDPSNDDAIILYRSRNENEGLEFSYSTWLFIDDWNYKYGEWKHVFHKGNDNSWPNRAPGVWLHPRQNKVRVYMNTFSNPGEHVDIDGIFINKWWHLCVTVRERYLDIYINGHLKKRHILSSLPKQNFGDLYVNAFGGFSGYVGDMKYFDYAIPYSTLRGIIDKGPSRSCAEVSGAPPYLATNWWQTSYGAQ
tara:strand:- start:1107 stop:1955 length:849 start_codon:yes stop_codon:yes gene_type:complete